MITEGRNMTDFDIAYNITRKIEGGWHNASGINSADRGGETFKGIARKFWGTWSGWKIVDELKKKPGFPQTAERDPELNRLVREFFRVNFWDPLRLSQIRNQAIKNELFDTAVNIGVNPAGRMLQRALNYLNRDQKNWKDLDVDGKIGPQTLLTLAGLNEVDQRHVFNLLNVLQGAHYIGILDRDRSQEAFIRGWLDRVELMR